VPTWADVDGESSSAVKVSERVPVLRAVELERAREVQRRQRDERDEEYDRGHVRKVKKHRANGFGHQVNLFQEQAVLKQRRRQQAAMDEDD